MTITRYNLIPDDGHVAINDEESPDGAWVKFEDAAAALAERDELLAERDRHLAIIIKMNNDAISQEAWKADVVRRARAIMDTRYDEDVDFHDDVDELFSDLDAEKEEK